MSSEPTSGSRFVVRGRVQGVGFRWWTAARARELGVTGTVRNLPDGSVEVQAFGPDTALAQLRDSLGVGPPSAAVAEVREEPLSASPPDGFEIVH